MANSDFFLPEYCRFPEISAPTKFLSGHCYGETKPEPVRLKVAEYFSPLPYYAVSNRKAGLQCAIKALVTSNFFLSL
jgi:hypothetical protein